MFQTTIKKKQLVNINYTTAIHICSSMEYAPLINDYGSMENNSYKLAGEVNKQRGNNSNRPKTTKKTCTKTKESETQN